MKLFFRACFVFLLFLSLDTWGQNFKVNGVVRSASGNLPMEGVVVTDLKSHKMLVTDEGGAFAIELKDTSSLLRFSLVGFKTQTLKANKTDLVVLLVAEDKTVDEVIVTGYGQTSSKRGLPYQAPTVTGAELAQTRRTNFLNALAGRVPGLTVTSTSGMPGASASVMMRGGTSIGGNNQPLFVVDGVAMDNSTVDQSSIASASSSSQTGTANLALSNRNSDYTNRIADMNPEDIESVTILKGPEATAIYGSDGAGGAIVITTKKGKAGKARIGYGNSFTMAQVYRWPEIQKEYSRGTNGIYDPTATNAYGYYYFGPKYDDSTVFYDNMKHFFRTSFSQQQDLSVESGTKDLNFRISGTYVNQNGVVPNTKLTRYNFRFTAF
ncbi:MAG: SusC/RagA family TonB-linked outer membrane protein, partial [Pseudopedobacter saltans]